MSWWWLLLLLLFLPNIKDDNYECSWCCDFGCVPGVDYPEPCPYCCEEWK